MKQISELFTACYDTRTNTIYGCKEGSLIYLHEEGHKYYQEKGINSKLISYTEFVFLFLLCFIIIKLNNLYLYLLFLLFLFLQLLPELLAWYYAFKNIKKIKEGQE